MSKFVIMNKDVEFALIDCTKNNIKIINTINGCKLNKIMDVNKWLDDRFNYSSRQSILRMTRYLNILNREDYLNQCKALSLNDTFWTKRDTKYNNSDDVKWDKISLYRMPFNEVASNISLHNSQILENLNFMSPSPELNTNGMYNKCWKRYNDGNIYLLKNGGQKYNDVSGNYSYSEVLASLIASGLNISNSNYIKYNLVENKADKTSLSSCKLFTNEVYGYIPIGQTKFDEKCSIQELLEIFKNDQKSSAKILEMILFDALIVNIDRHTGNFGFIVENETQRILSLAPIFDNNLAFAPNMSIQGMSRDEIVKQLAKLKPKLNLYQDYKGTFIEQAKFVLKCDNSFRERVMILLNRLNDNNWLEANLRYRGLADSNLSKNRLKFMIAIVKHQCKLSLN